MRSELKKQKFKLMRAVRRLVDAELNDSWKGGGDPADIPDVEKELVLAKLAYRSVIAEVFTEPTNG